MRENQKTCTEWADHAFGPTEIPRIAARANEEMAELIRAATTGFVDADKISEEAADIVIILYRLVSIVGRDLHGMVDKKMVINRGRKWERDGTGHGYHVRERV